MRRLVICFALLAILAAAPAASGASWAKPYIREAVNSGLMGPSVENFRPNAALTRRDLGLIVAGITHRERAISNPDRAVTMTELNRALVNAIGLNPAATAVRAELTTRRAQAAGARRLGNGRPPAPASLQPPFDPRQPRASPRRPGDPRRGGLLGRPAPGHVRVGSPACERPGGRVPPARLLRLAAPRARARGEASSATRTCGAACPSTGRRSSASPRAAASTARGSSGASTSSSRWPDAPRLGTTIRGRTTYAMAGEMRRTARIGPAEAPLGGHHLLRLERPHVEAQPDHAHGNLHGRRVVHPLLGPGNDDRAARRLVFGHLRMGP